MRSLSQYTTLILIGMLVALLTTLAVMIGYFNHSSMMDMARKKNTIILSTQATNAAIPMWDYDTNNLEALVGAALREPTIIGARIMETNKKRDITLATIGDFDETQPDNFMSAPITMHEVGKAPRTIGRLEFYVDYTTVHQEIVRLVIMALGLTTLVFSTAAYLMILWIRRAIAPVHALSTLMVNEDILHRPLDELKNIRANTSEAKTLVMAFSNLQSQYLEYKDRLIKAKEEAEHLQGVAEKANKAKSDFLANMSHELRTPLNSIIGLTQILTQSERNAERLEMMKAVEFSSKNLLHIVNDILDLSKIESDSMELEKVSFNPHNSIQSVVLMLKGMAQDKGLIILSEISIEKNTNIKGDPKRFSQVLTNLVGNAIKYTEDGRVLVSGRLVPDKENPEITILEVKVQDTGIGIPHDRMESIFEKFVQADASITRRFGGTGLGLSITRQLVTMMGGKIEVESMVGIGSSFTLKLPVETTQEESVEIKKTAHHEEAQNTLSVKNIRICVAEDHPMNQLFVRKLLTHLGFENFFIVENGALAVESAEQGKADLILMDCHMPVMSGYEATTAIRQLEKKTGTHLPIVAMTANALAGERDNCLRIGMDEYISKPVDRQKFVSVLSKWINFDDKDKAIGMITGQDNKEPQEEDILDLRNLRSFSDTDPMVEREMASIFIKETDRQISKLNDLCIDGECLAWREITHMMKGAAATIGAEILRSNCEKAQQMVNTTAEERKRILADIESAYAQVMGLLRKNKLAS